MKGIIFNAEMVKAVLEGKKTVTRRPVNDSFAFDEGIGHCHIDGKLSFLVRNTTSGETKWIIAPYQPGETVYGKETWKPGVCNQTSVYIEYKAGGTEWPHAPAGMGDKIRHQPPFWRPSIHMPEWASRIKLAITDVRAERLHEITEEEAMSEGIHNPGDPDFDYIGEFSRLWDSIYRDKCPWDSNPWILRIEFKVSS